MVSPRGKNKTISYINRPICFKFTHWESLTQLCFLGLPIQVRDTGLAVKEDIPRSDVNKEYYTQNMEREVEFLYILIYQLKFIIFLAQIFAYNYRTINSWCSYTEVFII